MSESTGSVIVSSGVLATIARLTALSVPGVARMNPSLGYEVTRLLRRKVEGDGVHVEVDEDVVSSVINFIECYQDNMDKSDDFDGARGFLLELQAHYQDVQQGLA